LSGSGIRAKSSGTLFRWGRGCCMGKSETVGKSSGSKKTLKESDFAYSASTGGIRILVRPVHLPEHSDPSGDVFSFAYTVRIINERSDTVQLLERHWLIMSNGVRVAEVVGPGVVGEQPSLAPGQIHEYSSSAVIQDPIGSMEGSYTFRAADGSFFDAKIPTFDLFFPLSLH
jgi:ApaG protein